MDQNKDQTLIVKIVCVLLSFGLWLYITNVENPTRTYEVKKIPVELTNIDAIASFNFAMIEGQNFTVDLKIEGPSSEVIKMKPSDFEVIADMSAYALKEGENIVPVQIIRYPENISIKNNGYLSIKVNLESIEEKEFPIKSRVKINYNKGIQEVGQVINPKTVKVTGGKSTVGRIVSAVIDGQENDVSEGISKSYEISFIDVDGNKIQGIESNIKEAQLSTTITNGKSVPIKVNIIGSLAEGYELESYEASNNSVALTGSYNKLKGIEAIETEPIDISALVKDTEIEAKLNIPEGVTLQNQNKTIKVKFKILEKEQETADVEAMNIQKSIICNVEYINLNKGLGLEAEPKSIQVQLNALKSEVDNIKAEDISVIVDLSQVTEEGTYNYKPKVTLKNGKDIEVGPIEDISVQINKKE